MAGGAPRTWDRVEIAEKLLDWSKKDTSYHLGEFCADIEIDPNTLLKWTNSEDEFGRTYRIVKARLGARREKKEALNHIHSKGYELNVMTYDPFLLHQKQEFERFKSDLAKEEKAEEIKQINCIQYNQKPCDDNTTV